MKTLYITDLDGTMLDGKGNLSFNSETKLNKLISDGALFTVATARTSATVNNIFRNISLNMPYILMNGVLIYDPVSDKNISAYSIDHTVARKITDIFKKYDNSPMLYFMRDNCLEIVYDRIHNVYQGEYVMARDSLKYKKFTKTDSLKIYDNDNLIYMVSLDKCEILNPIYDEIKSLDGIYCAYYSDNYTECNFMECMNRCASKGSAALKIKELLGIDRIIAFGDNLNDIPLCEAADEAYAVENACDEIKSISNGVIGSNENDGVINFIYDHFYNKL